MVDGWGPLPLEGWIAYNSRDFTLNWPVAVRRTRMRLRCPAFAGGCWSLTRRRTR